MEPSAGSGNLIHAIRAATKWRVNLTVVELDVRMADYLRARFPLHRVATGDFTAFKATDSGIGALGTFDRIVMNPPFTHGADIAHIKHALAFLRPGGRLIAICADGPGQNEHLRPIVEQMGGTWEPLPPDTFKESGTSVRTALINLTVEEGKSR